MIATDATDVRTPDVRECFHEPVEAPVAVGEHAVARLELLEPLVEGLVSLGLEHRIVWRGAVETENGEDHAFGLIWDFDDVPQTTVPAGGRGFATYDEAGSAKLLWTVAVDPSAEDGFVATISLEAWGSDAAAREQLLDVWPVVGPLAEQHARRMLATIKSYAEDYADET